MENVGKGELNQLSNDSASEVISLSRLFPAGNVPLAFDSSSSLAETGAALLQVDKAAAFVCKGSDEFRFVSAVGVEDGSLLMEAVKEIARVANTILEPVFLSNLSAKQFDMAVKLAGFGIESLACVPEVSSSSLTGVFVAMSQDARVFTDDDVRVLKLLAAEAAVGADAMDSGAREEAKTSDHDVLFDLAHRKIRELTAVQRVSQAVSSTLDIEKLLEIALENGLAAVGADAGSLMLVNPETKKLEIAASKGISKKLVDETSQPIGKSIAGYVAKNGVSVLVSDARRDDRFKMSEYRDEISTSASVPLLHRGQVIGVLNVNSTNPRRLFDERDVQLLETLANQMAVAIENGRLHARVIRRTSQLDSLLQISKTITSSLNLDVVLRRLSDEICSLFGMQVCVIMLVDSLSGRFHYGYGSGLNTRDKHVYMDLAMPLATRVKSNGHRIMKSDITQHKALGGGLAGDYGFRGAVCIPFTFAGKLVAVAAAFSKLPAVFPQSVKDIAKSLPELAGVAIQNARIYRNKYRIAQIMQSRLVPREIPAGDKVDIGLKFVPARDVGGDYCDFIRCGDNDFIVVLGDVAGSDVDAAEYTLMGKHVIRAYAKGCESASEVLSKANVHIYEDTDPEVFISAFYGHVYLDKMEMEYATAGCEPAILYRRETGEACELRTDGIVLGITCEAEYTEQRIGIRPGDILALVTDGITEAGAGTDRFRIAGVKEVLHRCCDLPAQALAERVYVEALNWAGGVSPDDLGVIIIKIPHTVC